MAAVAAKWEILAKEGGQGSGTRVCTVSFIRCIWRERERTDSSSSSFETQPRFVGERFCSADVERVSRGVVERAERVAGILRVGESVSRRRTGGEYARRTWQTSVTGGSE